MEGRPLEDAELVDLARDGDVPAYEELVTRYQGIAHRVAWLVARQAGEAEDAVQEAFVKAYYALPRFRSDAPFRPWLLRIVANEARNRVRSSRRRDGLVLRAEGFSLALDKINEVANLVATNTMSLQYLDALKQIGSSPSTKFVVPMELATLLAGVTGQAGRAFSNGGNGGSPPAP